MDYSRFLACLEADFLRMRDVVDGHLAARVPTCPDWTVADLTRHVGEVYLHKVEMMRQGKHPDGWPPAAFKEAEPVGLLTRGYGELVAEFAARNPTDATKTWYDPDQTVGFWIRRMAQETVIHRIDAELGAGTPVAPVPDDLAIDGIDELRDVFVMAATNRVDQVDPALLRPGRFDRVFEVPSPDRTTRAQILAIQSARLPLGPGVDLDSIADSTAGFVGAELAAICREAGRIALRRAAAQTGDAPILIEQADLVIAADQVGRGRSVRSQQHARPRKRFWCP